MKQVAAYLRVSTREWDTANQLPDMEKWVTVPGLSGGGLASGTETSIETRTSKGTGPADPESAQAERGHTAGVESGSPDRPVRHTHNMPSFPFAISLEAAES